MSLSGWVLPAAALIGGVIGLSAYTFIYARGGSYLTTNPAACANCHIMREHYAAWTKSSHRLVATCSECHMPHDLVGKYMTKASNGFWHSVAFTTGRFPDPLQIKPHNREVVERACRACHEALVAGIEAGSKGNPRGTWRRPSARTTGTDRPAIHDGVGLADDRLTCVRCHLYVGHWVR